MRRAAALLDSPVLAVGGLALVLLADGTGLVRLGLCASLVHECGHLLVYWLLLHRLQSALSAKIRNRSVKQ